MKNTLLTTLLLIALAITSSQAQVGIGVATADINLSAQLDVVSTTKGFLPPRMTYAQRNAIVTPGAGLIVYCTDCGSNGGEAEFYNGAAWVSMYGLQGSLPTLAPTSSITAISNASATSGGAILTDGGVTVFIRGLCWSTSSNPTNALSTKTVDGSGTGAFTSAITGLTNNTTYYVRSYATNAVGTAYGNEVVFTTVSSTVPTISTFNISTYISSTAICGGNISADGNATVTNRGVCWSTNSNPTIALSTKTVDGTGIGSFTSAITGLTDNSTYYVRSYATNAIGTAYGNQVVYTVIPGTIGLQVWTTQNLNVSTYRDGTPIPEISDPTAWANLTTGAWCYYENNAYTNNGTRYGKLYNWYAVAGIYDASSLSDVSLRKNLAPAGYHIPTDAEWTTLTDYLGGISIAGGKMKEVGTSWRQSNVGGNNSYGFAGLPGGCRDGNGYFHGVDGIADTYGYWWNSTEDGTTNAWYRHLYSNNTIVVRLSKEKSGGLSVRCIKD